MFIFKLVVGIFYNITIFGGLLFLPARIKSTRPERRLFSGWVHFPGFPVFIKGKVKMSLFPNHQFVFKLFKKTIAHKLGGIAIPRAT